MTAKTQFETKIEALASRIQKLETRSARLTAECDLMRGQRKRGHDVKLGEKDAERLGNLISLEVARYALATAREMKAAQNTFSEYMVSLRRFYEGQVLSAAKSTAWDSKEELDRAAAKLRHALFLIN